MGVDDLACGGGGAGTDIPGGSIVGGSLDRIEEGNLDAFEAALMSMGGEGGGEFDELNG